MQISNFEFKFLCECVEHKLQSIINFRTCMQEEEWQLLSENFEDTKIDEIDDESFKSAEALLIKLTNPEDPVKLIDFLKENNIDDIMVWLEKHRIVLKNSEDAWKHLDQPSELGETHQFYKYGVSIIAMSLCEVRFSC